MTALNGSEDRMIIPRWRMWKFTRWSSEVISLSSRTSPAETAFPVPFAERVTEITKRMASFKSRPGIHSAADLVGTALVLDLLDHDGVTEAAQYVISQKSAPINARKIAERALGLTDAILPSGSSPDLNSNAARDRVVQLRRAVSLQPRNAICWADLAHAHTTLGTSQSALKAMRIALALSPDNRFILRSATRLHLQMDNFDTAHDLLVTNPRRLEDPWVLAAEIATANLAGRPIRNLRRGRQMLDAGFTPLHISELASALAALELQSGNTKQARRLLRKALEDPTENAVAQAEWSAQHGVDVVKPQQLDIPQGFEARALYASRIGDFKQAVEHATYWLADQPFALDPAIFISYTASLLAQDYEAAAKASQLGLITNPNDPTLLNNLAFALASMDQPTQAAEVMRRYPQGTGDTLERAAFTATRGLIAYRLGDIEVGRKLYLDAVETFRTKGRASTAAIAIVMWACEEIRSDGPLADEAIELASSAFKRNQSDKELNALHDRFEQALARRQRIKIGDVVRKFQ
ncbi:hypothetical protein ACRAKI_28195 [Saccharothrix isguenensis]